MKKLFLLFLSTVSSVTEREWISSEVGNPAGLETTSVRKEVHVTSGFMQCMGLATTNDWASLACYLPSVGCSLFEMGVIVDGDVTRDETLGPTECKVRRDLKLCFGPESVGFLGDRQDGECPNQYTCTANGWQDTKPAIPATTCDTSKGYSTIAGMCLYIPPAKVDYCISRASCQADGGDIASFETAELFDNFRQHLIDSGYGGTNLFLGLVRSEGNWAWKFNNRYPGDPNTGDWGSNAIDPGHTCSYMQRLDSFLMNTAACTVNLGSVCRIYL